MCQVGAHPTGMGEWGVVSYEAGVRSDLRAGAGRYGSIEARPAGFRQPTDMIGRAYEPRSTGAGATGGLLYAGLTAGLQLVLPVLLLLALGVAAFLYGDRPVTWFGPAQAAWLTMGHLAVPLTFFAIALTNRRYGAGYALAQTVMAWALAAAAISLDGADLAGVAGQTLPDAHVMLAYGGALFAGHVLSVVVFDRTRGPRWWTAPFQAVLWGGLVFCLIAFPALYLGTTIDWFGRLVLYAGIMAGSALALLVPYWLLRRMVPPMSGFGGY